MLAERVDNDVGRADGSPATLGLGRLEPDAVRFRFLGSFLTLHLVLVEVDSRPTPGRLLTTTQPGEQCSSIVGILSGAMISISSVTTRGAAWPGATWRPAPKLSAKGIPRRLWSRSSHHLRQKGQFRLIDHAAFCSSFTGGLITRAPSGQETASPSGHRDA